MTYQPKVYRDQGGDRQVVAGGGHVDVRAGGRVTLADDQALENGAVVRNIRMRVTAAQINAGHTLVPAVDKKYRLHDWTAIAIGGNAATATSVDINGTQGGSAVKLAVVAVAALTRSTAVKPNSANVTLLADGASHMACDAGTPITIGKAGSNLATATHVDVMLSYTIED